VHRAESLARKPDLETHDGDHCGGGHWAAEQDGGLEAAERVMIALGLVYNGSRSLNI